MKTLLDRIGSSFFVSSFVPAFAFLILVFVLFEPVFPSSLLAIPQGMEIDPLNRSGLLILILAILLAFSLSSLSSFNLKLFQGYYINGYLDFLTRRHTRAAAALKTRLLVLERLAITLLDRLKEVEDNDEREEMKRSIRQLWTEHRKTAVEYNRSYPSSIDDMLPTRFGNVIRAAEEYSKLQYGIDKDTIWPRLLKVISEDYYHKLEQSENMLLFVVNSTIFTFIASLISLFALFHQYVSYLQETGSLIIPFALVNPNATTSTIYLQRVILYFMLFLVTLIASFVFYRIAVLNAGLYGNMMRGAFDLFRHNLMRQLCYPLPEGEREEFASWTVLCDFYAMGQFERKRHKFKYQFEPASTAKQERVVKSLGKRMMATLRQIGQTAGRFFGGHHV